MNPSADLKACSTLVRYGGEYEGPDVVRRGNMKQLKLDIE